VSEKVPVYESNKIFWIVDPNFWPVAVWLQPAGAAEKYKAAGVNIFVAGSDSYPAPRDIDFMNQVWDQGMYTFLRAAAHDKWAYYFKPGNPKVTEYHLKDADSLTRKLNSASGEGKAVYDLLEEKSAVQAAVDYMAKKGSVGRNQIRALAEQLATVVEWKDLIKMPAFAPAVSRVEQTYPDLKKLPKNWRNRRIMEAVFDEELVEIPMLAMEHSSFLGWLFGDEPDLTHNGKLKQTPEEVFAEFVKLRSLDNRHPIFLNLGCGVAHERFVGRGATDEMYPRYAQACDILCYDVYPCNSIQPDGPNRLHLQGKGVKRLREWAGPDRKVWTWLEVNHFSKKGEGREPTHDEIKTQHWMAIVHGANGHGYFCHSWNKKFVKERMGLKKAATPSGIPADTLEFLGKINADIQELAPVLNSPTVDYGTAVMKEGRRVDYRVKKHDGAVYLFAVNMYREPATAEFRIQGVGDAYAQALYDGTDTTVKDGILTQAFAPYEVRRYRITKQAPVLQDQGQQPE